MTSTERCEAFTQQGPINRRGHRRVFHQLLFLKLRQSWRLSDSRAKHTLRATGRHVSTVTAQHDAQRRFLPHRNGTTGCLLMLRTAPDPHARSAAVPVIPLSFRIRLRTSHSNCARSV